MILTGNVMINCMHLEAAGNVIVSKETESKGKRVALIKLSNAMKSDGALVIVQLGHAGRQTAATINPSPYSSTTVSCRMAQTAYGKPKPMTAEEIQKEVIDRFVYVAKEKELSPESKFVIGIKMNSADSEMGKLNNVQFLATRFEELGFNFIKLSGGSYENWQLIHKKETTKKREVISLSALLHLSLYSRRSFYFPRKILEGRVKSAVYNHFDQDFNSALILAQTQMRQLEATRWTQSYRDPCYRLIDFSDDKEAQNFRCALAWYLIASMESEFFLKDPYDKFFNYDSKKNYNTWFNRFFMTIVDDASQRIQIRLIP
ncbi:Oxidored-FMN domain-containing protein [Aphelenchoides besseyi]|nr:Oxidored-FMN domain-containing protein [Aphelenchoides besseyi]